MEPREQFQSSRVGSWAARTRPWVGTLPVHPPGIVLHTAGCLLGAQDRERQEHAVAAGMIGNVRTGELGSVPHAFRARSKARQ